MDAVIDKVNETYNFYLYTLTFSGRFFPDMADMLSKFPQQLERATVSFLDPRVQDWLLMQSPIPTLVITAIYLVMVRVGPKMMENHKPMELKNSMVLYNFACVVLSAHIVTEGLYSGYKAGYSVSCQQVVHSYDEYEHRIAKVLWWFYFSKFFEMLDTTFFILRKRNNQVTFLHVYHHATMFILWWIGIKWVAGGQALFGAILNSFIHVVMYSYYCLSAMGPQFHKFLWWKKYLTILQFVQFCLGMVHAVNSLYVQCPFPLWMQYGLIVYAISMFLLFANFYIHAYVKGERLPKAQLKMKRTSEQNGAQNGVKVEGAQNGRGKEKNIPVAESKKMK